VKSFEGLEEFADFLVQDGIDGSVGPSSGGVAEG
jgi:hypothetical protein